jgi:hypothetical protein
MIDELVLEDLLTQLGDSIAVPPDGAEHVVDVASEASSPSPRASRRTRVLMVAAAIVLVAGLALVMGVGATSDRAAKRVNTAGATSGRLIARGNGASASTTVPAAVGGGTPYVPYGKPAGSSANPAPPPAATPAGPTDAAKIVKTGSLDLQVPRRTLRVTTNRVTGVAVGLGGYVAKSSSSLGSEPTAQITIRVPVGSFETAIARLDRMPGVKVLGQSENGSDVTAQYTDLQAQLRAATTERDSLLLVLSRAQSIGDILQVHDRLGQVQAQVEQTQGRINQLGDQAAFSSLAVSLSEKPVKPRPAAHAAAPPTGLAKAWSDARHGFADTVEWLIARAGGALVVLLAGLALLFGLRHVYPVVRRALL